jgi:hypothetical protein
MRIIGSCSLCGGRVVAQDCGMPYVPSPRCQNCGAVAAVLDVPVIPMKKPAQPRRVVALPPYPFDWRPGQR